MITLSFLLAIFFTAIYPNSSLADEPSYICVTEEAVGFHFKNDKWGKAHFNVSEDKFIIRKIKEDDVGFESKDNKYVGIELGRSGPTYWCSENKYTHELFCKAEYGRVLFSPNSGRFLKTYTVGYVDGKDNDDNTPSIARGRCSKF